VVLQRLWEARMTAFRRRIRLAGDEMSAFSQMAATDRSAVGPLRFMQSGGLGEGGTAKTGVSS